MGIVDGVRPGRNPDMFLFIPIIVVSCISLLSQLNIPNFRPFRLEDLCIGGEIVKYSVAGFLVSLNAQSLASRERFVCL